MIPTFDTKTILLASMLVFLSFSAPLDIIGGIISTIVGIFQAIVNFFASLPSIIGGLWSSGSSTASHVASQTYSTTVKFVSNARSFIQNVTSHDFNFANPIQSVDVTLTLHNVGSMHLASLSVDFHVAGQTITIPVTNPLTGPDIAIDSGPILLGTPLSLVGVTLDITGTLCGSGCSNLTFTPSADIVASVPPSA